MSHTTSTMAQDQASFRFDDLPYELQYEVTKQIAGDSWGLDSLLLMACVNSHCNKIANKLIDRYEFDYYQDFDGDSLENFIRVMMRDDGARAAHMRRLHLTTHWDAHARGVSKTAFPSEENPVHRLGAWIMEHMSGLRELLVAYTPGLGFLDTTLPPKLETLIVRPEGLPEFKWKKISSHGPVELAGPVNAHFLPAVLRSKSLKTFHFGGQFVENDNVLVACEVPVKESPIEHLVLRVGNFSDEAFLKLLQAPSGLRSLEFTPTTPEDVEYHGTRRSGLPTSDAANLPAISTLGAGLAGQATTLESLTVRRGDSYWRPALDQIGSLAEFKALKHLEVDCTMLLGWNHCDHLQMNGQGRAISPSCLANLLPASIETLTLKLDSFHKSRNGKTYLLDIVKSLKKASSTRLSNLRTVTLNLKDTLPYCEFCEEESQGWTPDGTTTEARWQCTISIQEARAIREVLTDGPIEFKIPSCGLFWDEDDVDGLGVFDEVFEQRPWLSSREVWDVHSASASAVAAAVGASMQWVASQRERCEWDRSRQDDCGPMIQW